MHDDGHASLHAGDNHCGFFDASDPDPEINDSDCLQGDGGDYVLYDGGHDHYGFFCDDVVDNCDYHQGGDGGDRNVGPLGGALLTMFSDAPKQTVQMLE